MTQPVLLLSDLHLPSEPSPLRAAFLRFLEGPARTAAAVYLLGDVFEYWIGDDVGLKVYAPEVAALRQLTQLGVRVYVQRGNRDFLIGARFADATGVQLLPDPYRVELFGVPTLLSHGDLFCTDDRGYQRWRRFAHHPWVQRCFLALPRRWRERAAGNLRGRSRTHTAMKAQDITDVTPNAIQAACVRHDVRRLIYGHTHRPGEARVPLQDGVFAERIVLADWRPERMEYLALEPGRFSRCQLDPAAS